MQRSRILSTLGVGVAGAVLGSFAMMIYASTHFVGVAGPNETPPAVSAAPAQVHYMSDESRIIDAVKRVSPSVVAIEVTVNGQQFIPVDPFAQFFGGPNVGQVRKFEARASGSGFVIQRSGNTGYIVTNAHVVDPPEQGHVSKITVVFKSGDKISGTVYSENLSRDLALLKVTGYDKIPPALTLANSDKLDAGQWAIAIGEPFELAQSVSLGIVSGFHRNESVGTDNGFSQQFSDLLQTSAPINPGNSGGPLVDSSGQVIGVNQIVASPQAGAQGIGFAIPANTVKSIVADLERNPGTHQGTNSGYIGVALEALTPSIRAQLNNYVGAGVLIAQVSPSTPAEKAGLNPGDVIQQINGKPVSEVKQIIDTIGGTKPGQSVALTVWSNGTRKLISVTVAERPAAYGQPQTTETTAP